jgi:murein DD-endopeptidase MepM/ murein hydrolase activator NlpD
MRFSLRGAWWCGVALFACLGGLAAEPTFKLVWPTPNTGWAEGKPPAQWLQHAGSGDPATGGFGGVRSGGTRFHEGIDIRPVARGKNGEATDSVFAAMAGVVRHVVSSPGQSGYGRHVVLEHTGASPSVYTLYAHLARIEPGIRAGASVVAGQTLGLMGHSSGGYMIPAARAHLHFEVGVAITNDFQSWYERRRFGSRNEHGMWNGMNLVGVDPVSFFEAWRAGRMTSVRDFFLAQPTAVRLRVATFRTPDFVTRYPALLTKPLPFGPVAGWEIRLTWTGLPFAWTPLSAAEVAGLPTGQPQFLEVDAAVERRERSKSLAVSRRGGWVAGKDLEIVLQQLFGTR